MKDLNTKIALFAFIAASIFTTLNSTSILNTNNASDNSNLLYACPTLSTGDFTVIDLGHKIRVEINHSNPDIQATSWASNNPGTTTLDYDGGTWAYFHNNGYGYIEVTVAYEEQDPCGDTPCGQTSKLLYY